MNVVFDDGRVCETGGCVLRGVFITVRSGSSRLPNKALKKINGLATIEHLINRVKRSVKADKVVVCTTELELDDEICRLAEKNDVNFFRGSVKDKLERCLGAAQKFDIEYFINVDGDDLFCEVELIDLAFGQYDSDNHDFIKTNEKDLVCGAFTFGIKTEALEKICSSKRTNDAEAAWLLIPAMSSIDATILADVPDIYYRPEIRATLDYEEDLHFFKFIINNFYEKGNKNFSLRDVIEFVDLNPEILMINKHRHKDYLENQKRIVQKQKILLASAEV